MLNVCHVSRSEIGRSFEGGIKYDKGTGKIDRVQ
jgi:hypothetical protein